MLLHVRHVVPRDDMNWFLESCCNLDVVIQTTQLNSRTPKSNQEQPAFERRFCSKLCPLSRCPSSNPEPNPTASSRKLSYPAVIITASAPFPKNDHQPNAIGAHATHPAARLRHALSPDRARLSETRTCSFPETRVSEKEHLRRQRSGRVKRPQSLKKNALIMKVRMLVCNSPPSY